MRIHITVADDMVERLDKIANEMGVTRSALAAVYIGQGVIGHEMSFKQLKRLGDITADKIKSLN